MSFILQIRTTNIIQEYTVIVINQIQYILKWMTSQTTNVHKYSVFALKQNVFYIKQKPHINHISCILRIQIIYIHTKYYITHTSDFSCDIDAFPFRLLSSLVFSSLLALFTHVIKRKLIAKFHITFTLTFVVYFFFSFYSLLILHLFLSSLNYILHSRLSHLVLLLPLVYHIDQGYMNLLNTVHFMN